MLIRTPVRTMFDSNRPLNPVHYVGNARSVVLMITIRTAGAGGVIKFNASASEKEFNPSLPSSVNNFYTHVAINDLESADIIVGSGGISVAVVKLFMVEINTNFINYLSVDTSSSAGANVNIDVVTMDGSI